MNHTETWRKELKLRTGWSSVIIDAIRNKEEAEIYVKAGLKEAVVGGRVALIQPRIDPDQKIPAWYVREHPTWKKWRDEGWTNRDIIGEGFAPFSAPFHPGSEYGMDPYELHHIGQHPDSPLAELTAYEHRDSGNFSILHTFDDSEIDRQDFANERGRHWMARYDVGWE